MRFAPPAKIRWRVSGAEKLCATTTSATTIGVVVEDHRHRFLMVAR